jgi:MacB-like periplasmic core domain
VEAVPGQGYWEDSGFTIVEHPPLPQGKGLFALNRTADPGYFAAMGIPILRGRTFGSNQRLEQANEVIVSQQFVQQHFPGEEPLGKHLRTYGEDGKDNWVIVGVVGDTRICDRRSSEPDEVLSDRHGRREWGNAGRPIQP